ncbi:serine hydrolase [Streptomyces sp. NPDC051183]|uniref:D-alanyl-D-alanine carboxypeptidase family protein n=1 Tax=Streptomyces sp. NPDC051183 TaxID=3155165 RepID=UPI00343FC4FE
MVAIEEELVAGESPDKSVDEGASGAAESSEERDPRLSVLRPREPESPVGDRDPLRDAVAAWVATAEPPPSGEDPDSAEPSPSGEDPDSAEPSPSGEAGDSAAAPAAAAPAAEPTAAAPEARAAEKPAAAPASPAAAKPAAPRATEAAAPTPAAEAAVAPAAEKPAVARAADEPAASRASEASASTPAAGEPADSERTAVFRAVAPAAAADQPRTQTPAPVQASDSGSAPARPESPRVGAGEAADSERTAVFRVVKPGSGLTPAADSERTAAFRVTAPVTDKPQVPAADEPADSERTAVFRAIKPGSASAPAEGKPDAAGEPADSERTAVFRAVKPGSASRPPAAPAAPADEPADSERTAVFRAVKPPKASTFVPLRTDDADAAAPTAAPAPAPTPVPAPAPTPAPAENPERTTQQPLPPKPPLDMLADLTNNPPPPPSALRTTVRRFKIYAPIVALLAIVLAVVQLVRPMPEPKLKMTANTSYAFQGSAPVLPWPKEGQAFMAASGLGTVGTFGEQKPIAIGSVAKVMTAYVILKDFPLKKGEKGQLIDVDRTAVEDGRKNTEGESTVDTLKEGDKLSQYDALAAIMIPSANNVARLLARWDGGQEAFVKKMNDTAKSLGMANTTYTDPSGLDATTVSTAEDQVKLGLKVVEMPELVAITKLPNWTDPSGKLHRNYNDLVPFNGAVGIKTGSTTKAGGNLLFAAEKKVGKTNQLIVGAVLGQHGVPILGTAIAASKQVMLATQQALTNAVVVKKGEPVGYVDDGLGGRTPVVATADVEAVGWPSLTAAVKLSDGGGKLPQTAKAGTEVGVLTVGEGASQVKVPVALQNDLAAPTLGSKLTRVG